MSFALILSIMNGESKDNKELENPTPPLNLLPLSVSVYPSTPSILMGILLTINE
jgi:hypothetical protein